MMMPSPVASGTVSTLRVGLRVRPGPTQVTLGTQPRSTKDEVRLACRPGGRKAFQSFLRPGERSTSSVRNSIIKGTQVQIIPGFAAAHLPGNIDSAACHRRRVG